MTWFDAYRFQFIPDSLGIPRPAKVSIHKRAWHRWRQNNANYAIYMVWVLALIGILPYFVYLSEQTRLGPFLFGPLEPVFFYGAFAIVGFGGHALMRRFRFAPCVWAELHARGYPICHCGYPTADLPNDAPCPECGFIRPVGDR